MAAEGHRWIYFFGGGSADGDASLRALLGNKGASLAEMTRLGIPVPPGFTITTEVCRTLFQDAAAVPAPLREQVEHSVRRVEDIIGRRYGDPDAPLLVSVRAGGTVRVPGARDTVLNLGLTDDTVRGLQKLTNNRRFAYDAYRRLIQMYADLVGQVDGRLFEDLLADARAAQRVMRDSDLDAETQVKLCETFKRLYAQQVGQAFPQDPWVQLWSTIGAVFHGWNDQRMRRHRRLNGYVDEWGTAANIQSMVFGNLGEQCATGIAFTRDPTTGERVFYGEYLVNAQGEDVLAGTVSPSPLTRAQGSDSMEERFPEAFRQLLDVNARLEQHFRDMQDIEFTVQEGRLWLLQTRDGARSAAAAVRIAVDMVREGLIKPEAALTRVDPRSLQELLHPNLDPKAVRRVIAKGLAASPGAASGHAVFSADAADATVRNGERAILVRIETGPEDVRGMQTAEGVLTARGGMTSHAAVVARAMGKCCVVGCSDIRVRPQDRCFVARDGVEVHEGDVITLDGKTGEVILGTVGTVVPELGDDFATLMSWADDYRSIEVRANADTVEDAGVARRFGASGIGLCRTEHMFFAPDRIIAMREMILATSEAGRRRALAKILPFQRGDFIEILRVMAGRPVTVRLLDPPLHEFLPKTGPEMQAVAHALSLPLEEVEHTCAALTETNPMLGHRGCRLGVTYPEIYEVQVRAIFEAACILVKQGTAVSPEVMIPLVSATTELTFVSELVHRVAREVMAERGSQLTYRVGTMIELPRACLLAGKLADAAEFFSFGTNDLTQTTWGLSRDDSKFLQHYLDREVLQSDPFVTVDTEGVGALMRTATELGRAARPGLVLGVCGEHGGDPASVRFFHDLHLDYVSCSPYRVPVARLAAAQAAILAART